MSSLILPLLLSTLATAAPDSAAAPPSDAFSEELLARAVWQRSADLAMARQGLIDAQASRDKSHVLPNPTLSGTWATIPIGARNPPDIGFWDVPNYTVQLGQLFELGKRGPRQRAAEAALTAGRFEVEDVYRQSFFSLLDSLSNQAEAVIRASVLTRLVTDDAETLRLQRARADHGDVAALEVDRLEVEHLRLLSSLHAAEEAREEAAAECSRVLGSPCPRFSGEEDAQRFLARGAAPVATGGTGIDERADLRALQAHERQSEAELTLAERQKIPDVSVSVGYQHDQFLQAGNQGNSLSLGLSIPLPVFDHGQVEAERARRTHDNVSVTREILTAGARESVAIGQRRLALLGQRARDLDEQALPRARGVLERVDAAARRGGVALQDVLLARRAFEELQLDRVEVEADRYRASVDVRRAAGILPRPPAGAPRPATASR